MSRTIHEHQVLRTIRVITEETGFPPDAEELAAVLNVTPRQIQSALMGAKMAGEVRYDENECFVLAGRER